MTDRKESPATRDKGVLDETRELFDQLVGEAQRREAERQASVLPRGPIGKVLAAATVLSGLLAAGTLLYGISTFLDAPIRETPSGYVGKTGKHYSREHFEAFELWKQATLGTFAVTFAAGFAMVLEERMRKRR